MNSKSKINSAKGGVDILKYKGFIGTVNYSDTAEMYYGKILNAEIFFSYDGKTQDEIAALFYKAVDDYLLKKQNASDDEVHQYR